MQRRKFISEFAAIPLAAKALCQTKEANKKHHDVVFAESEVATFSSTGRIELSRYSMGVVPSEGLGGPSGAIAIVRNFYMDRSVLVGYVTSNTLPILDWAKLANSYGRKYGVNKEFDGEHGALACVECNRFDVVNTVLRFDYRYPSVYRWRHFNRPEVASNKFGWYTQSNSKPRLDETMDKFLEAGLYSEKVTSPNDAVRHAAKIALYCANEVDIRKGLNDCINERITYRSKSLAWKLRPSIDEHGSAA